MNLIITNPLGYLALLGIPAVLLIHFLQRRAKPLPVSTLFLIQRTQRESSKGRRFERLINSIPLWLQLLLVLLLTWLLVQPRFIQSRSTQRIVIILDSSASMRVFKSELLDKLESEIPKLQQNAANLELWILESDPAKQRLYYGSNVSAAIDSLTDWSPSSGATDPRHALKIARSLAGPEGATLYLTDTPVTQAPFNTTAISIGSPKPNAGFTGVSFEDRGTQLIWKATLRNYDNQPQSRTWHLTTNNNQKTDIIPINLPPNSVTTVQGIFPPDSETCTLHLNPDLFNIDDVLPIVKPLPKSLAILTTTPELNSLSNKIKSSFANITTADSHTTADLIIQPISTIQKPQPNNTLEFLTSETKSKEYLTGTIIAEKHPLLDNLNWQTLIVKKTQPISPRPDDKVLLWQAKSPLIILRTSSINDIDYQNILINFDIHQSNLLNQDAFPVFLLRLCEQIRTQKHAPESSILETSQPIKITTDLVKKPTITTTNILNNTTEKKKLTNLTSLQAPHTPGFLTIATPTEPILTAAVYFADTREADLSSCEESYLPASTFASATNRHSDEDPYWRYWLLTTLAVILASWHFANKKPNKKFHAS